MHSLKITTSFLNVGVFLTTLLFVVVGLQPSGIAQQEDLSYFLDVSMSYDPSIPTPKEVLGYEVGEWHVRHDQLVEYMYAVAAASDRVTISEYARSYENRKLLSLIITSPENHAKLDDKRNSSAIKQPLYFGRLGSKLDASSGSNELQCTRK